MVIEDTDTLRLIERMEKDNLAFADKAHDEGLAEGLEKGEHNAKNVLR